MLPTNRRTARSQTRRPLAATLEMQNSITRQLVVGGILSLLCCGCVAGDATRPRTTFCPRGVLSPDEIETVLIMGRRLGIQDVEEVRTYYVHPSSDIMILVKERDRAQGRKVTVRQLDIVKRGWVSANWQPSKGKLVLGDFWELAVTAQELTVFNIGKRVLRVGFDESIPYDTAQTILTSLLKRDWRIEAVKSRLSDRIGEPVSTREMVGRLDDSWTPVSLRHEKALYGGSDVFVSSFLSNQDQNCSYDVFFRIEDGKVIVIGVTSVMA